MPTPEQILDDRRKALETALLTAALAEPAGSALRHHFTMAAWSYCGKSAPIFTPEKLALARGFEAEADGIAKAMRDLGSRRGREKIEEAVDLLQRRAPKPQMPDTEAESMADA